MYIYRSVCQVKQPCCEERDMYKDNQRGVERGEGRCNEVDTSTSLRLSTLPSTCHYAFSLTSCTLYLFPPLLFPFLIKTIYIYSPIINKL